MARLDGRPAGDPAADRAVGCRAGGGDSVALKACGQAAHTAAGRPLPLRGRWVRTSLSLVTGRRLRARLPRVPRGC